MTKQAMLCSGQGEQTAVEVRVHGRTGSRMYLRGWSLWWPGARLVREGWRVDVYLVSGSLETFQAACEAIECRID